MAIKTSAYPSDIQQQRSLFPQRGFANGNVPHTGDSSLEWYRLTESSREVLGSVMAAAAVAILNEEDQKLPNLEKIEQLEKISEEVHLISNRSNNFQSLSRMKAIIRKYTTGLQDLESNG